MPALSHGEADSVSIRPYRDCDLQAVTDIYNEAVRSRGSTADLTPQTLQERRSWVDSHHPRDRYPVVVIETFEGVVAGFASLSRFMVRQGYDGVVELSYYIGSPYRRRGYGSALVRWLVSTAAQRGNRIAVALVFDNNEGSKTLLRSNGFVQYGLLPKASWNGATYLDLTYWYRRL